MNNATNQKIEYKSKLLTYEVTFKPDLSDKSTNCSYK